MSCEGKKILAVWGGPVKMEKPENWNSGFTESMGGVTPAEGGSEDLIYT